MRAGLFFAGVALVAILPGLASAGAVAQSHPSPPRHTLAMASTTRHGSSSVSCVGGRGTDCPQGSSNFVYRHGPLVNAAKIYLVDFVNGAGAASGGSYVDNSVGLVQSEHAIRSLVRGGYSSWWSEFSNPSTNQFVYPPQFAQVLTLAWQDPQLPGTYLADETSVSDASLRAAMSASLAGSAGYQGMPVYSDNNVFIIPMRDQQVICIDSSNCAGTALHAAPSFCGYHATASYDLEQAPYIVLPKVSDQYCGYANEPGTTANIAFDDMTAIVSHELLETITDPQVDQQGDGTGWYDVSSQNEIADACATDPSDPVTVIVGSPGVWAQLMYSPVAKACIASKTSVAASVVTAQSSSLVTVHLRSKAITSRLSVSLVGSARGRVVTTVASTNRHGDAVIGVPRNARGLVTLWVAASATRTAVVVPLLAILSGASKSERALIPVGVQVQGAPYSMVTLSRNGVVIATATLNAVGVARMNWMPWRGIQHLVFSSAMGAMTQTYHAQVQGR